MRLNTQQRKRRSSPSTINGNTFNSEQKSDSKAKFVKNGNKRIIKQLDSKDCEMPTDPCCFSGFICYRRDSGEDLAEHLKKGLEGFGLPTFLDVVDIPGKFKGTQKWANIRNIAIRECKIFVLLITPGFESSEEIKKELRLAKSLDKVFVCFRHEDVADNLRLDLGNEKVDLSKYQQISFDTKEDLLRKAYAALIKNADHDVLSEAKGDGDNASQTFLYVYFESTESIIGYIVQIG